MSTLTKFRDHCRAMAEGAHTADCERAADEAQRRWGYFRLFREWQDEWGPRPEGPPRACRGDCLSDADRALFARLAVEVDDYLDPHPSLFEDPA